MRIDSNPATIATTGQIPRRTPNQPTQAVVTPANRGADTVSFSKYVIRSREQVRAEAALANAQKGADPAQKLNVTQKLSAAAAAPAESPAQETPAAAPASNEIKGFEQNLTKRVYGQQDLDAVTAAWGATRGDRAYNTVADANGDGTVNFDDQNFILANWGKPVIGGEPLPAPDLSGPFAQQHLDAVKERFGAKAGEERYLEDADANGDGVIDFNDITHVITNWGQPRTPPSGS